MLFDIITISAEEVEELSTIQLKLLRTAQQKKNELYNKLQKQLEEYKAITMCNNASVSSLYECFSAAANAEYERQVDVIREQLQFNMTLKEPTTGDESGDNGNDTTGYLVDYELSYLERYVQVRDFYMAIPDPNERMILFINDTVAQEYLGTYYNYLFDYLKQYTQT